MAEDCLEGCGPCEGCCSCDDAAERATRRWRAWAWGLTSFTVAWNVVEGGIAIVSGLVARSIALVGFGLDSLIETSSALVIAWRLSRPGGRAEQRRAEERAVRLIAVSFFAIAVYVAFDAVGDLLGVSERPAPSVVGMILLGLSLVVMPALVWAKRLVAARLGSVALQADAAETLLCIWLSGVVLIGLAGNAVLGLWWMDSLAALVVAALAVREGWEAWASGNLLGSEAADSPVPCIPLCCAACPAVAFP